jgi:hypothetical protein
MQTDDYWLIGHAGIGGQNVKFDIDNQLAFAYITNGLKPGLGDTAITSQRLFKALYECL